MMVQKEKQKRREVSQANILKKVEMILVIRLQLRSVPLQMIHHLHLLSSDNEFLSFIKRKGMYGNIQLIWMDHVKLCKCLISKNHFVMQLQE
ncbi:unnamed protein product [Paramecium sonneborni]|uniref:Uncharacterized protein n=1 Tax=Paramecium sonneborni TaxID=65129 RepID=A0A8S1RTW2_9CILI|nr:unnamed protein product [Paramecium sonneborni]